MGPPLHRCQFPILLSAKNNGSPRRTKVMKAVTGITALGRVPEWNSRWDMRTSRAMLVFVLLVGVAAHVYAAPFTLFPKAGRLRSPDGRYEVRDVDQRAPGSEFAGVFHSLLLIENETGKSRTLCDYVGVAAVAWSEKDFLVITQYLSKKTSRALVFNAASAQGPILLDVPTLVQMVPVELRPSLRGNDHLFVEASRLDEETFYFRVWGYGRNDPNGFRWNCRYSLSNGGVSCEAKTESAPASK